jgi:hypothetical protein
MTSSLDDQQIDLVNDDNDEQEFLVDEEESERESSYQY